MSHIVLFKHENFILNPEYSKAVDILEKSKQITVVDLSREEMRTMGLDPDKDTIMIVVGIPYYGEAAAEKLVEIDRCMLLRCCWD